MTTIDMPTTLVLEDDAKTPKDDAKTPKDDAKKGGAKKPKGDAKKPKKPVEEPPCSVTYERAERNRSAVRRLMRLAPEALNAKYATVCGAVY